MYDDDGTAISNIYSEAQQRLRRLDALIEQGGPYENYNRARRAQLVQEYNDRLQAFGYIDPHVEDV